MFIPIAEYKNSFRWEEDGLKRGIIKSWIYKCKLACVDLNDEMLINGIVSAISYALSNLISVLEHLEPSWARAFLRRTRFMDPDFQGDVLAVICTFIFVSFIYLFQNLIFFAGGVFWCQLWSLPHCVRVHLFHKSRLVRFWIDSYFNIMASTLFTKKLEKIMVFRDLWLLILSRTNNICAWFFPPLKQGFLFSSNLFCA